VTSRMRRRTLRAAMAIAAFVATGCTQIDHTLAKVPVFAFMRDAPSFDPYEHPLPPAPGSVPFESPAGTVLAPLQGDEASLRAFAATPDGQNPLSPNDPVALALGKTMYDRHCSVCHGPQGAGDGSIVGGATGLPQGFVPPLASGNALTLPDGYVYGVIRAGRGRMPAYGPRTTHVERWAIVNYVNSLQGAAGQAGTPVDSVPAAPVTVPADTTPSQQ
jgi:mono/diheme cytochrome c family protein